MGVEKGFGNFWTLYLINLIVNQPNSICRLLTRDGSFPVKSFFKLLNYNAIDSFPWSSIWKSSTHSIVIFFWVVCFALLNPCQLEQAGKGYCIGGWMYILCACESMEHFLAFAYQIGAPFVASLTSIGWCISLWETRSWCLVTLVT